MDDVNKAAGNRLRLVRKEIGKNLGENISGVDMASRLDIPQTTYARYERGIHPIDINVLVKLWIKFKVYPHYMCTGILPKYATGEDKATLITDISEMKGKILALEAICRMLLRREKK